MISSMKNAVAHYPFGSSEYATQYQYGGTVIADGDAEAVGIGSWQEINGATVTKESGGRPGSGGSFVLRVRNTGGVYGGARQLGVLTIGRVYRIIGWTWGDGTVVPVVGDQADVDRYWTGTASTSCQYFDFVFTAVNTDIMFSRKAGGTDNYVEFDDISVIEVRPQTLDVSGNGLHALFGDDGLTSSEFPTKLTTSVGYSFDAADYFNCGTDSKLAFSETMTLMIACSSNRAYPSDDGSIKYRGLIGRGKGTATADHCFFIDWYGTNATRTLRLRVSNGVSDLSEAIADFDMIPGRIRTIVARLDGSFASFFIDGEPDSVPTAQTINAQIPTDQYFTLGSRYNTPLYSWDGNIYETAVFNYALPDSEIREYHHDFIRRFKNRI